MRLLLRQPLRALVLLCLLAIAVMPARAAGDARPERPCVSE